MTCIRCNHTTCVKAGSFGKRRVQRWKCTSCKNRFSEPHAKLTRDTFVSRPDAAAQALKCLLEGCSIRSTERLTGLNRNTIMRLLIVAGEQSRKLMDVRMRGLRPRYLELDEIWTWVVKKQKRVRKGDPEEFGSQWVFVATDAETKLIPAFHVGQRLIGDTTKFMWDLYGRMADSHRTQITTDGLHHYRGAVPMCFGLDADFAQLTKMFGDYGQFDTPDARYSPPRITGVISKVRTGDPDPDHISTSMVERQNLTMRMAMRRFTRLTNAFSKKLSHLKAAIALHFAYYNFCRVHSSLRITPADEQDKKRVLELSEELNRALEEQGIGSPFSHRPPQKPKPN
jgi:transposase-like protein/IS1 family transposase